MPRVKNKTVQVISIIQVDLLSSNHDFVCAWYLSEMKYRQDFYISIHSRESVILILLLFTAENSRAETKSIIPFITLAQRSEGC